MRDNRTENIVRRMPRRTGTPRAEMHRTSHKTVRVIGGLQSALPLFFVGFPMFRHKPDHYHFREGYLETRDIVLVAQILLDVLSKDIGRYVGN